MSMRVWMREVRRTVLLAVCVGATAVGGVVGGAVPASAISGGVPATEVYPFMASLQRHGEHFCGGTLVDPRWILTAKHCVLDQGGGLKDPKTITARLGSNDRTEGGEVRTGTRIETSPGEDIYGQDVALIELDAPAGVAPAALPDAELAPGEDVRTIGWGQHDLPENPGDPWPDPEVTLRQLDTEVAAPERCPGISDEPMAPNELCMAALPPAGDSKWPQTFRAGDSGGPLLAGECGTWTVHGVVSRGAKTQNGILASVHDALPWLTEIVGH